MRITVILRTLKLSLKNILANKKQNLLAIATVILGSLTISTVFTVNANVNEYIDHLIQKNGGPNLFVDLMSEEHHFEFKDYENLRSLSSTSYLSVNEQVPASVRYNESAIHTRAILYDKEYGKARPVDIIEGQAFGSLDETYPKSNVIINEAVRHTLGLHQPIGKRVSVGFGDRQLILNIIGVGEPQFDGNGRPMLWLNKASYSFLTNSNKFGNLILGTSSYENLDIFESLVRSTLVPRFGHNVDFYNPKNYFEKLRAEYETFIKAGAIVGLLALLGGTLGVLNLMLLSIKIRIKEIGLYRALGFPTSVVLLLFISESMITLNIGGAIGSALGCLSGYLISGQIVSIKPFLTHDAFFYGFFATFAIGILFAYFPAHRAAKIETVEALRS